MKKSYLIIIVSVLLGIVGCETDKPKNYKPLKIVNINPADTIKYDITGNEYQDFINKVRAYQKTIKFTKDREAIKTAKLFDINPIFDFENYLGLFDELTIRKGYQADLQFFYFGGSGRPLIYVTKEHDNFNDLLHPFVICETCESDYHRYEQGALLDHIEHTNRFTNFINFKPSKNAAFQYTVLHLLGNNFGLWDHSNYGKIELIVSKEYLNQKIQKATERATIYESEADLTDSWSLRNNYRRSTIDSLSTLDPTPKIVVMSDSTIHSTILTFNDWEGLVQCKYLINLKPTESIELIEYSVLLEYNCGILF